MGGHLRDSLVPERDADDFWKHKAFVFRYRNVTDPLFRLAFSDHLHLFLKDRNNVCPKSRHPQIGKYPILTKHLTELIGAHMLRESKLVDSNMDMWDRQNVEGAKRMAHPEMIGHLLSCSGGTGDGDYFEGSPLPGEGDHRYHYAFRGPHPTKLVFLLTGLPSTGCGSCISMTFSTRKERTSQLLTPPVIVSAGMKLISRGFCMMVNFGYRTALRRVENITQDMMLKHKHEGEGGAIDYTLKFVKTKKNRGDLPRSSVVGLPYDHITDEIILQHIAKGWEEAISDLQKVGVIDELEKKTAFRADRWHGLDWRKVVRLDDYEKDVAEIVRQEAEEEGGGEQFGDDGGDHVFLSIEEYEKIEKKWATLDYEEASATEDAT
uniref:Uncharacterized protein n=1 Tax=Chromera velia CCMP2878 TaxID=1169474 RepID=A0A0G4F0N9_9ALVE|eukprot:Cvel_2581.t1-p1 / transcript=Cvel_2581.t1 / gene=Cvel_2581 / organism=Chromera_velia_CCMP2878 / gene_product=hypothetical protein / transcript_product=hypothetical protein / location=Cvel_scaffold102:64893-67002(-) / protein_length=377 / sequence_SO=supercontig / SO=protein_coding / is_pseudo=false